MKNNKIHFSLFIFHLNIKNMANCKLYIALLSAPFIAACSGDDLEQYAQRPDNAGEIGFVLKTENVTRTYNMENPHPATMGVYGYHDLSEVNMGRDGFNIFSNTQVNYADGVWSYEKKKYWADYSEYNSFDFFGYMPRVTSASFVYSGDNSYTLSFTATLDENAMQTGKNAPLICNLPNHKDFPGDIVRFDMDQTLTGFQLKFKLGTKMSKVRDFEITKVEVSGDIPFKGRVSRTYTYDGGTWTQEPILWNISPMTGIKNMSFEVPNEGGSLTLSDDTFHEWGSPFYAIPVTYFTPKIKVTYNVKVDTDGTITRENVTNEIVFNKENFANLKKQALMPGKLNDLEIAIVPDHLYVLADADQYIGYLVME